LIGFTPVDEQAGIIPQEARVMFKLVVSGIEFGVVAAAIEGKVDCVDYISHLIVLCCVADPYYCCFFKGPTGL
jgi:hypothetical protein